MEAFEYNLKDSGHSFRVNIAGFTVAEVYYEHPRCSTPVTQEKAEELANTLKAMIESTYPINTLNKEDYEPSGFAKMLEAMAGDSDCDDDDCECGSSTASDLFKMMMLASLMKD